MRLNLAPCWLYGLWSCLILVFPVAASVEPSHLLPGLWYCLFFVIPVSDSLEPSNLLPGLCSCLLVEIPVSDSVGPVHLVSCLCSCLLIVVPVSDSVGPVRAPTEPGKRILQRGRIYKMVLWLDTATWPGRGPCLAETVWAGSRDRFLFWFGNGSNRNRELGLLGRDSPERDQRDISCLVREWLAGTRPQ